MKRQLSPLLLALASIAFPATVVAANFKSLQAADVVLGQPDFTTTASVSGQPNRFANPDGIALDPATGKVFISDTGHHRVLRFSSAAAAQIGAFPEAVFGQPNFSASSSNQGGAVPSATTLSSPVGLCVDSLGRLWVADFGNNRVLGFFLASYLSNDPPADLVLGQPGFVTNAAATTQATMNAPYDVNVGPNDTLWVADRSNNRVLRFAAVTGKSTGANADGVLGQPDFITSVPNTTVTGMSGAAGVWADPAGRLWVGDVFNNRVLRFDHAIIQADADGASADAVIGQPNFTSLTVGTTASSFNGPYSIYADPAGNLWVSDYSNRRILRFRAATAITAGGTADLVLGQPNFTTTVFGVASAQTLGGAGQISPGAGGSLLIADYNANRALRFSPVNTPAKRSPLISLKGSAKRTTHASKLVITGLSGDSDGMVVAVKGNVNAGGYTAAKGVSPWKYTAKRLKLGTNRIKIRAIDNDGLKSEFVRVTITRK